MLKLAFFESAFSFKKVHFFEILPLPLKKVLAPLVVQKKWPQIKSITASVNSRFVAPNRYDKSYCKSSLIIINRRFHFWKPIKRFLRFLSIFFYLFIYLFIYLFESDTRSIEKRKNTHNNNNKKRKQAGKKNKTFELHQQLKTMFIVITLVEEIAIHRIVNIYITRKATSFYKSINKFSL